MTDTELLNALRGIVKEEIATEVKAMRNDVADMIENQTANIQIIIEADVTKKVDALMDAYAGGYEKQTELEVRTTKLEHRVDELEVKAG